MIILNEKEFAQRCLQDGLCGASAYSVLLILAKYYRHVLGYKANQLKMVLLEYCRVYCPYMLEDLDAWHDQLRKILKQSKNCAPREISGVSVRQEEISWIQQINGIAAQRLMFTLICLAKFCNLKNPSNNNWVNYDWTTIFTLARVTASASERAGYISKLYQMNYVEVAKKVDSLNLRVTHISEGGMEAIFVSDFRELGYEYENYCKGGFFRCGECDRLVRSSQQNRKYCNECQHHDSPKQKILICEDCGHAFLTSSMHNRAKRCRECSAQRRRELTRARVAKYQQKLN